LPEEPPKECGIYSAGNDFEETANPALIEKGTGKELQKEALITKSPPLNAWVFQVTRG